MKGIRFAWVVLAIVAVGLSVEVALWPMLQITDCELGLYSREVPGPAACAQSIWSYFGVSLVAVLVVPAVLCVIPAVAPRLWVSWSIAASIFALVVVGFLALGPSILAPLVGFIPIFILAVGVALAHQFVEERAVRRQRRDRAESDLM